MARVAVAADSPSTRHIARELELLVNKDASATYMGWSYTTVPLLFVVAFFSIIKERFVVFLEIYISCLLPRVQFIELCMLLYNKCEKTFYRNIL